MRCLGAALAILASTLGVQDASAQESASADRVRPADARVRQWLDAGAAQSATFRHLLADIAASDLIVYLRTVDRVPGGRAALSFMASTAAARYVRIDLVADQSFAEMVALVGHELQHAVEVANVACVRDAGTMAMLYHGMGDRRISRGHYDSVAARAVETRVRLELAGRSTANLPPAPALEKTATWTPDPK